VCRLKKALYGLKQSPRSWFDKFSSILFKYGFLCTMSDHSVFSQSFTVVIVLIINVDDIIIRSDSVGIANLKAYLNRQFHSKDLGTLRCFF